MASASQRLETVIAINAQVGNGFSEIGSTLTQLGAIVDGISGQLIDFGKDSISVYRDYQKSMKDSEVALSTSYGRGTKELADVMSKLDASATEWAASSIFHTNDVANAISEAAHAGWDYEQIISGIPAAMQLAQAGSLDLSDAVNYIVKATTAAGVNFEDMAHFTDLWAFAANSSASTIGEFGEAMLRMGNTMRFVSDPEELMTLIAVTANAGTVGSEAGTMIRNSLMRLIAPTDKANEAMADLGATSDEVAALMNDQALAAANARLEAEGFSAYDANGELKPFLDTYTDLYMALGNIAGGFDNIEKNRDALEILSAIFPTRTITEALTLLRSAAEGYDGLYEAMKSGEADGYGAYAAETMMDTLDGKIETFLSKVERLKQLLGEELSDQVGDGLEGLGDIIDNIAGLDEQTFSSLVAGLEVIAAAGPGMLIAGSAFRMIGNLLTPSGAIAGGMVAFTAFVEAAKEWERIDFASNFGNMEIDDTAIQSYLTGISDEFKSAYKEIDEFRDALKESVQSYQDASEAFSSKLLTNMLTDATLSESDIAELQSLGDQMNQAVIEGIELSTASSMSYWQTFWGGADDAGRSYVYQNIIDLLGQAYDDSLTEVESIGQNLRDALTSAFADGKISDEEYQNILSYVQAYNEAIAQAQLEAQNEQEYIEQQKLLHKAQTASFDEIKDTAKQIEESRDAALADAEETYIAQKAKVEYEYNRAIENGTLVNGRKVTESMRDSELAKIDAQYQQQALEYGEKYDNILYKLWDTQIQQSDFADAYNQLGGLADKVLSGEVTAESAVSLFKDAYGGNMYAGDSGLSIISTTRSQLSELLAREIAGYGGYEGIEARISDYEAKGDTESANKLRQLYAMQQINDNFAATSVEDYNGVASSILGEDKVVSSAKGQGDDYSYQAQREQFENFISPSIPNYSLDTAKETIKAFGDGPESIKSFLDAVGETATGLMSESDLRTSSLKMSDAAFNDLNNMVSNLASQYDFEQIRKDTGAGAEIASEDSVYKDFFAAWSLLAGEASQNTEKYRIQATAELDSSDLQNIAPITIPAHVDGEDSIAALQSYGATIQVSGDTQQLEAAIDGADGHTLLEYVDGNAQNLEMSIRDQDGQILVENVTGDAEHLANTLDEYSGQTVTVDIQGQNMFLSPELDDSDLQNIAPITIPAYVDGQDSIAALESYGATVQVNGDTQQLEAAIDGADGHTLLEYVDGNAQDLEMTIRDQDGQILVENVTGDAEHLANTLDEYSGQTVTVDIQGQNMFLSPELDDSDLQNIAPITIPAYVDGQDSIAALESYGATVQVNGDTQQLEAAIDGADGHTLLEYVDGNAQDLEMTIRDQDGQILVENVTGDAEHLANTLDEYSGQTVTVDIQGENMFLSPELDDSDLQNIAPITIPAYIDGQDSIAALESYGATVQVNGDTQQLKAAIDGASGRTLLEYVDGNAQDLEMSIHDQDGKTLVENVTGNAEHLASTLDEYSGQTVTVDIQGKNMFVTPEVDNSRLDNIAPITIPAQIDTTESIAALESQGLTIPVDGSIEQLKAAIDKADSQTLLEYVDGDIQLLQSLISGQDGRTLTEYVTGDASSLASIINSYNGKTVTVNIQGRKMFAAGGRATTASTFGEDGPEWAIPEEHTERTAQLLNEAREASGFTWTDLLGRYGDVTASAKESTPTTIVYSPTINAADVTGVEKALKEDKERLKKWLSEKKMFDEVEVYT